MITDTTNWLLEKLAEETGVEIESISTNQQFESMNLDSLSLLSLAHEIESAFAIEVDPTALTEYDNVEKLAKWIQQQK